MGVFYLHGIQHGATFLSELSDGTVGLNSEEMVGFGSGHPYPLFRAIRGQAPSIPFTSEGVGSVLDLIVANGGGAPNVWAADLSFGNTGNNTDVFYRQGQDMAIRYASGVSQHHRFRLSHGFMFWDTISAAFGQDAQISAQLVAAFDGTNVPIIPTGSTTVSGTPSAEEFYTLGKVVINGTTITGEQDWSLASGATLESVGGGSDGGSDGSATLWPTYTAIKTLDPVLSLNIQGAPWGLDSGGSPYTYLGESISSLVWYLRKKAADGTNVPDATASHIKFTATDGLVLPQSAGGGANDPAISALRIALRAPSGSNNTILTIDTTSAIT